MQYGGMVEAAVGDVQSSILIATIRLARGNSEHEGPMQPVLEYFHITFGQITETCFDVIDNGLNDGIRNALGGQHVKKPGHRITHLPIKTLQCVIEGQTLYAEAGIESRRGCIQRDHGCRLQNWLPEAIEILADGQDPMIAEMRGVACAARLPSLKKPMQGLRFRTLGRHACKKPGHIRDSPRGEKRQAERLSLNLP